MKNKYNARKTTFFGIEFDSYKEANRYLMLRNDEKMGTIKDLTLQPVVELQPKFKKNGKTYRAITYRADFSYFKDGRYTLEDAKGVKTEVFKIKEKLFHFTHPDIDLIIS